MMVVTLLLILVTIRLATLAPAPQLGDVGESTTTSTISRNSETTCPGDTCLQSIQISDVPVPDMCGDITCERFVGQMISIALCSSFVIVLLFGCLVYCTIVCAFTYRRRRERADEGGDDGDDW